MEKSDTDSEYQSGALGPPTKKKLRTEIVHKMCVTTYSRQDFKPSETQSIDNESRRGLPLQIIGDIVIEHDNNQMEVNDGNLTIDHVQKPRQMIEVRLNKAPKTSAERGREFRARKALLKQQCKQQQKPDAIVEIATDDIQSAGPSENNQVPEPSEIKTIERRAKSAEATRRWRAKKKGVSESSKKQAKTAAQRVREYRERKKLNMMSNCETRSKKKEAIDKTIEDAILKIKNEIDNNANIEDNVDIEIKIENDVPQEEPSHENVDNIQDTHENIQFQFKVELDTALNLDATTNFHNPSYHGSLNSIKSEIFDPVKIENKFAAKSIHGSMYTDNTNDIEMKNEEETTMEDQLVDVGSIDSNEVAALNNVEACLLEQMNIKTEDKIHFEDDQKMDQVFGEDEIKRESNVMETHLISNKLINSTSTITNSRDGLIQSQTTNTLVMEILPMVLPMVNAEIKLLHRNSNPEVILPTLNNDSYYNNMEYDNSFQLNSITGNVLSLEQKAYGLLKAKHKIEIQDKKYICTNCQKYFKSLKSLKYHLKVHDTIERRAQGVIRGMKTRKLNLKKKRRLELKVERETKAAESSAKQEGYACTCGKKFRRRTRMETCLRSHDFSSESNSRYPCVTCAKVFKDKDDLVLHRKRLHSRKKFPCKFCPTDYNTRKELFKHLQIHQKVQLMEYKVISEFVKGKQKLKCFMCAKSYSELSELKCHIIDDHKSPYICPNCEETFPKIFDFCIHTKKSHPEIGEQSVLDVLHAFFKLVQAWKCEECEIQFYEPDKLALHQIEKHGPDSKTDSRFQCEDCRRVFVSQKGLQSHRRVHHSCEFVEETKVVENGIMCLECRKMCKDLSALTSHMRLHSPDRKYPCKFCDLRFATLEKRKVHSEIHTGDMKYVCFICDYQCSSENRLKYHKMTPKHLNMKEYLLTGKPLFEVKQSTSEEVNVKEENKNDERTSRVKKKKKVKKEREKHDDGNNSDNNAESDNAEATCDICGDKFSSESEMLDHKDTHPFIEIPSKDKPTRIFFK